MITMNVYDMVVVGGGPAGYTAALYAARAGLSVAVLEKLSAGGQMALSWQIDNYPGFPEGIDGFELAEKMQQQAERFGAQTRYTQVNKIDLLANPKHLQTSDGDIYGKTVVLATGAVPRQLGLPGELELMGKGVAYCAACEGMFFKGKTVAVVGGGNSAVQDVLLLSRIAKKVFLIHRRGSLRAEKVYAKALDEAKNVEILWNAEVSGMHRMDRLSGIAVRDVQTGKERELSVDGLFIAIGRKPATELVQEQLELEEGYIKANETTQTNIPGVYAVGDVRTKLLRQIVTATADGAMAVHMAQEHLSKEG